MRIKVNTTLIKGTSSEEILNPNNGILPSPSRWEAAAKE